jgi:8-oxo-dGTP pyrophosphatase MutT (NUDIX family)
METQEILGPNGKVVDHQLGKVCTAVGVGVIIIGDGRFHDLGDGPGDETRFLTLRRGPLRSDEHPDGVRSEPFKRAIPGGGIEYGEDPVNAAVREVAEKVGVLLGQIRPLFFFPHSPPGEHWISLTYVATLAPDSPKPTIMPKEVGKVSELRYYSLRELLYFRSDELTPSMHLVLNQLQHRMLESMRGPRS